MMNEFRRGLLEERIPQPMKKSIEPWDVTFKEV